MVDAGGNLVADIRMDQAWVGSVDITIGKAFTSRAFDASTADLGVDSTADLGVDAAPGAQFFGINASDDGRVMIFAGGEPLRLGNCIVGAVGGERLQQ